MNYSFSAYWKKLKALLLIMRLISFFIFVATLSVSANSYSQQTKINLRHTNAKVSDILLSIENNSRFIFIYDADVINSLDERTIDVKDQKIEPILKQLFEGTNVDYRIDDRQVFLYEKNASGENLKLRQGLINVSGKVKDGSDAPLPGVTVIIKGTTIGTTTDIDGVYNLTDVPPGATLQFSFVGMKIQEIEINGKSTINLVMEENAIGIEEIVAVGYGTMKKSDLAGSTGSVKSDVLEQRPVSSFNQALSGKISGVNVSTNSGRPGGHATVRIRGNSSISVTNDPLYVVDGVILNMSSLSNGTSPIDYINPNDIKSVEVLKDASATAIYGARGANGVILITTKKGIGAGNVVQYNTDFGVGVLPKKLDVLNASEFLQLEDLAYANAQKFDTEGWTSGAYSDPRTKRTDSRLFNANGKPLYDTDWQDETIRNSKSQTHQLLVSNSNDGNSYGLSLGYRDEEGLIINSWLKRYSGRFFMDSEIRDWLKIGGSLSYFDQRERQTDSMGDGGITVGRQMVEELPVFPVKYEDGSFAGNADYPGMEGGNSPVQVATDRSLVLETQTILGNAYSNITLADGLELRSVLGVNILNQKTKYYGGKQLIWISAPNGSASISNNRNNSWQFENYMTYKKEFAAKHSLTAMLGISWQHVDNAYSSSSNSGFEDDFFLYNNLSVGTSPGVGSTINAYGLNSYFTRINYSYEGKYLVTATARADGSSKFGRSNRYAFFPSFALAWRLSEEEFLKSSSSVSNLKLRTSYGVTGNSETGPYASQGGLGNYTVVFGSSKSSGIGISTLANPDLKWEKTTQMNVGLDLGLWNNKVNFEADYYYKKTSNMLLGAPVPASSGYTSITKNIGSMENKGFELSVNTVNVDRGDFRWETTFNLSFNRNEVLSLGEGDDDIFPGPDVLSSTNNIIRVGEPVGSFYGFKRLGTWNSDESEEAAKYGMLPGDLKLWDKNNDGEVNDSDKLILGKGIPDGYGILMNTLQFKNFEFVMEVQYMFGNDILDISKHSAEDRTGIANSYKTVLDAWTPENQNTMIAQIRPVGAGYTTNIDSHFVEDGSFIRGKNILLAYNLPKEIMNRVSFKALRVYGSVQNFFLISKYSGYDPEVSDATQSFAQGITVFGYPKPRTFTLGLNVTF